MNYIDVKYCNKCHSETVVINSRDEDGYVRRRRKCVSCGHRYSTVEFLKEDFDKVMKSVRTIKEISDKINALSLSNKLEKIKGTENCKSFFTIEPSVISIW